jgi:hypothetical protein
MICIVTIIRYPKYGAFFGVLSMALFHLPLLLNKKIKFYKLMGSGKDGSFSTQPDWRQWATLIIVNDEFLMLNQENSNFTLQTLSKFIATYIRFFNCTTKTFVLKPISSHGSWDGKKCFENLSSTDNHFKGKIAVLTRATIRVSKLKQFWKNVPLVNATIQQAKGLQESYGIGEIPFIKQATLSIWDNIEDMKTFAYKMKEHRNVIEKTRKENWYKEEMFTRFEVIAAY